MLKEIDIKTGDIGIIIKPKTILGKLIGLFSHNKSHAFNFAREYGILYVYEMEGGGCLKTRYIESDYINSSNWVLMHPVKPYDQAEFTRFYKMCENVYNVHSHYDIFALFRHLWFEVAGRYPVERKNNKKFICSEFSAICTNHARAYTFGNEQTITPENIFNSKFFSKTC